MRQIHVQIDDSNESYGVWLDFIDWIKRLKLQGKCDDPATFVAGEILLRSLKETMEKGLLEKTDF